MTPITIEDLHAEIKALKAAVQVLVTIHTEICRSADGGRAGPASTILRKMFILAAESTPQSEFLRDMQNSIQGASGTSAKLRIVSKNGKKDI